MRRVESSNNTFYPYQSRFMCCCGTLHAKEGAIVIGIVRLTFTITSVITFLGYSTELSDTIILLAASLVIICFIILLMVGIKKEKPVCVIPYMVLEGFVSIYCVLTVVCLIIILLNNENESVRHFFNDWVKNSGIDPEGEFINSFNTKALIILLIVYYIIISIVFGWWCTVIYKCYKYLVQLNEAREHDAIAVINYPLAKI